MPKLTAVSPGQFANKAWKRSTSLAFAAEFNMQPVVAAELVHLVATMPLGFAQTGKSFQLVAITSLQPNTNLYVASDDGRWLGSYVPALLRGYPFSLIKLQDREESILCIDEDSGLVVEAGQGEPFFDESGASSQPVKNVLEFLAQVERSRVVTQVAVDALQTAGLIQPWRINIQNGEQAVAVEGVFCIDEAALNGLPDGDYIALRKTGALPVAYAQLLSMNQLSLLEYFDKLQAQLKAQAAAQIVSLTGLDGFNLFQDDGTISFTY